MLPHTTLPNLHSIGLLSVSDVQQPLPNNTQQPQSQYLTTTQPFYSTRIPYPSYQTSQVNYTQNINCCSQNIPYQNVPHQHIPQPLQMRSYNQQEELARVVPQHPQISYHQENVRINQQPPQYMQPTNYQPNCVTNTPQPFQTANRQQFILTQQQMNNQPIQGYPCMPQPIRIAPQSIHQQCNNSVHSDSNSNDSDPDFDCSSDSDSDNDCSELAAITPVELNLLTNPYKIDVNESQFQIVREIQAIPNERIGSLKTNIDANATEKEYFQLFLTPEIKNHVLHKMNERRAKRVESRKVKGNRGRKVTKNIIKKRQGYLKRFNKPFSEKEFDVFLALLFKMSNGEKRSSLLNCWKIPTINLNGDGYFFGTRMKYYYFVEMYRCLDFDVDFLENSINENNKKNYTPGTLLAFDESMIALMMRNNPHHINMPKKPDRNGTKVYTVADSNDFLILTKLSRRTLDEPEDAPLAQNRRPKYKRGAPIPKQTVTSTVSGLTSQLENPGHVLFLDRFYGGTQLLYALACQGHFVTCTTQANRPSAVFRLYLHAQNFDLDNFNIVKGVGEIDPKAVFHHDTNQLDENLKFGAFVVMNEDNKMLNFLTSIPIDVLSTSVIAQDKLDNLESTDFSLQGKKVPIAANRYFKHMGHVDQVNNSMAKSKYPYHKYRWRTGVLMWYFGTMVHNSHVCYKLKTKKSITKTDFVDNLCLQLSHVKNNRHQICLLTSTGVTGSRHCVVCKALKKKRSSSSYCCLACGPMHKKCFADKHDSYILHQLDKERMAVNQ